MRSFVILLAAMLAACAPHPPPLPAPVAVAQTGGYRIAQGDKLRIATFGEDRFTGEFLVHANGTITFPLFGEIPVTGMTTAELTTALTQRLAPDYLREPRVTAEVISFRPVYILGEVAKPGQYAYSEGLTMYALIAQAGGLSYRANGRNAWIRRHGDATERYYMIESATPVNPGDTIRIPQRIF